MEHRTLLYIDDADYRGELKNPHSTSFGKRFSLDVFCELDIETGKLRKH